MNEQQEHYFTSSEPATEAERRSIRLRLADRTVDVETAPGTFSPDGLDKGTAVLLAEAPPPPAMTAEEVPAGTAYDLIWSNPPIRVGKAVLHDLMRTWLPRLAPDGHAYLVVQKNLGSDSLQAWIERELGPGLQVERFTSARGFRVLHVRRVAG